MQITTRNLARLGAIGLVAMLFAVAGCQSSSPRTTAQRMNDRQIKRGVKKALAKDDVFKYTDVDAYVYEGTIQLIGFAEYPEQRLHAAEVAARTRGAQQVINLILLKGTPTGPVPIRDPFGYAQRPSPGKSTGPG